MLSSIDPHTQAFVLGLAGLITTLTSSGLGLFFSAKARSSPLRELLYQQQLDLVLRIVRAIGKVRNFAVMATDPNSPFFDHAFNDLQQEAKHLSDLKDMSAALLPTELYVEISQLNSLVIDLTIAISAHKDTSWFPAALASHSAKTVLLARTYLGIDELSLQSAGLFIRKSKLSELVSLNPSDIVEGK